MSNLVQELKRVVRQLGRQPVFTATAVLTLAIGIGVNAVAFTVINGLLFKKPSGDVGENVGRIATTPGGDESGNASLAEYQRFEEATRGTADLAAEGRLTVAWRHDGTTEPAWVLVVSSNYFSILQPRALAGRVDVSPTGGGLPSVVIGERFWRRKLDAPPLAGLTLRLNETDVSVAGILPESFRGPAGLYSPDVWLPLDDLSLFKTSAALRDRESRWLFLLARLRPGVSAAAIQGQLEAEAAAMAREWPESHYRRGARFTLFKEGNSELRGLATAAAIAMAVIGLVLLLACFNTANLLLARATERERDIAIRAAIGAGPFRLVRLVAIEGIVVATLAGAASLVVAWWTKSLVSSFAIPIDTPQHIDLTPDATVVGFVLALVLIAAALPGLWPAVRAARVDVVRVLGSQGAGWSGGRPSRLRRWLVGAQVAGSTAFLAVAALLTQSYGALAGADLGFDSDRLVVAEVEPAAHGYDVEGSVHYADQLVRRVRALPGVADAALADRVPFFIGFDRLTPVSSAGAHCERDACPKASTLAVGPGYFKAMGIPLTAGREFDKRGDSLEVIVNQPLARLLWRDGRALGEALRLPDRATTVTVIGVTAKTHTRGPDRETPTLFIPLAPDHHAGSLSVVARTHPRPEHLVRPLGEAAQRIDPNVLTSVRTMRERMAVQLWPFRTVSWLFAICGGLALILSTSGLAGVVMHVVNRRRREFGVRMAIGATRRDLVADVLRGSTRLLLPGLTVGVVVAAAGARLLQVAFYGVNVFNPLTYVAVALLQSAIVVVACISPALRASRVDPLAALRAE
jgi:predicted permease